MNPSVLLAPLLSWEEFCNYDGTDPIDTNEKDRTQLLIDTAIVTVERYCSRYFTVIERVVTTQWKSSQVFKALPIFDMRVFVDPKGVFGDETEVTDGFWLNREDGILAWNRQYKPHIPIKYVYTGGVDPAPADLKEAIYKIVKWDKARIFAGQVGIRSQISGEVTTNFDTALPYEVRQTLDFYRLS